VFIGVEDRRVVLAPRSVWDANEYLTRTVWEPCSLYEYQIDGVIHDIVKAKAGSIEHRFTFRKLR